MKNKKGIAQNNTVQNSRQGFHEGERSGKRKQAKDRKNTRAVGEGEKRNSKK